MSNDDATDPQDVDPLDDDESLEDLGEDVDDDLDLDFDDSESDDDDDDDDDKPKAKAKAKAKPKPKATKAVKKDTPKRAAKKRGTTIETIMDASRLDDNEDAAKAWELISRDATDITKKIKYTLKASYEPYQVITHKSFGVGYVRNILSPTKIEVIFEEGFKRLVCNR